MLVHAAHGAYAERLHDVLTAIADDRSDRLAIGDRSAHGLRRDVRRATRSSGCSPGSTSLSAGLAATAGAQTGAAA